MTTIRFTDKEKWLVCDADGTKKVIRTMPKREDGKWTGKGVTILSAEHSSLLNITWQDEPVKLVEHKAWDMADFKF